MGLVGMLQVCKPRWPLCSLCTVNQMCPSACDPNKNKRVQATEG
jgi:hypothetical protein